MAPGPPRASGAGSGPEVSSGDLTVFGELLAIDQGGLAEDLDDWLIAPYASQLLLVDRLFVHPDWRGHGLETLFVAEAMAALARDAAAAIATYPSPTEGEFTSKEERRAAGRRIASVYEPLGFSRWRDGDLWVADPQRRDYDDGVRAVRKQFGV